MTVNQRCAKITHMETVQDWTQIGARIGEARLAAGLSQGQLAERLGVDRTAVVRLESGKRHVDAVELYRLAELLGVPMAHFLTRPPSAVLSRRTALTEDSPNAARSRYRMDAALEAHARDAHWLVRHAGLPVIDQPLAARLCSFATDPVRMAHEARQASGASNGPLASLAAVAERFGLYLTVVDQEADGASMVDDVIGVAIVGNLAPGRRRWTAAHELGHHLAQDEYHSDAGIAASRDEREQTIDRFVAELLLPREDMRREWESADARANPRSTLVGIAGRYRLSWSAVVNQALAAEVVTRSEAARISAVTPVRGEFLAVLGVVPQEDLEIGVTGPQWRRSALRAWRRGLVTASRAVELLRGALDVDDLPEQDAEDGSA